MKSIGLRIGELRKKQNVTQQQLADYLSVQPQTISRWETENGNPDVFLLPKIAEFFHVRIDDLFGINDVERLDDVVAAASFKRTKQDFEIAMEEVLKQELIASDNSDKEMLDKIYGEKTHLLLQIERKASLDAIEACEKWIALNDSYDLKNYVPARMQLLQLQSISAKQRQTNVELTFDEWKRTKRTEEFQLYLYALELDNRKIINEAFDQFKNSSLFEMNKLSYQIWSKFICEAIVNRNEDFLETYYNDFNIKANDVEKFGVHLTMLENRYGDLNDLKEQLLKEVECFKDDKHWYDYIKEYIMKFE